MFDDQPNSATEYEDYKRAALAGKTEESESNWLVSYADMMTLLVGFFIILISVSTIDPEKLETIKKSATQYFGGEYKVPFEELKKKLMDQIQAGGLTNQVLFKQDETGVEVDFRGALFFELGSATIKPEAREIIDKLVPIIQSNAKGFRILIEGHTDNIPTKSAQFASNWELSSVRACSVLRIFEDAGFPHEMLNATGYADTKPVYPNADADGKPIAENQVQNRRVVIRIIKNPAESAI